MNKLFIFIIILTIITSFYKQEQFHFNETDSLYLLNGVDYLINLTNHRKIELQFKKKNSVNIVRKTKLRVVKFTSFPNKPLLIDPLEINSTKIYAKINVKENHQIKLVKI
jgi:hypothetical protein